MKINIETKYNIKDRVYIICERNKSNDWYSNESEWRVMSNNIGEIECFDIDNIIVKQRLKSTELLYQINNLLYSEQDLFTDLLKAKDECKNRNKIL